MKHLLFISFMLLTTTIIFASPIEKGVSNPLDMSIYEAINKAGYQRMLTQRIAKSYMIAVGDSEANKYKEHLKGSARLFENNLKDLKDYAPTDDINNQFRYVEILWRNYKFIYSDEYTKENALIILKFNDKILKACNDAVKLLEEYAVTQTANQDQEVIDDKNGLSAIINISGRQRMLSQRMLFFAAAKFYGIGNVEEVNRKFNDALILFKTSFKELIAYAKNTEQIDTELLAIAETWRVLEETVLSTMNATEMTVQEKEKFLDTAKLSEQILF